MGGAFLSESFPVSHKEADKVGFASVDFSGCKQHDSWHQHNPARRGKRRDGHAGENKSKSDL